MKKDIGIALLRIGMGALILPHGMNKLSLLLSRQEIDFPAILGINPTLSLFFAVIAEVVCPLLLIIGFKTKQVVKPLIVMMLATLFYVDLGSAWINMELTVLYLMGFIAVYLNGSGKYSADTMWENFKKEQAELQLVEY